MGSSFWIETLGCPKNQVDSDKLAGALLADGLVAGRRPRRRRSRRRQHVRLRRGRPPRVGRHHPRPRRRPARRRPARRDRLPRRAVRAPSSPPPCPRSTPSPGSPPPCRSASVASRARRALDLLHLPRPAPAGAVGLREGRRGLRPRLRVLRHPVLPRPAAEPADRRRRRRGRRPRRRRRPRDRARRPGPRRPTGAIRASASAASSRSSRPSRSASTGCGSSTSIPSTSPTSSSGCCARSPCRTSTCRSSTCRDRSCGACGAGATASGSSTRIDSIRGPTARRRLPVELHRRLPGRDRGRPRRAARLRRRGPARLVRVLRLLRGGGHLLRRPRRQGARRARRPSGCRSCASSRTPSPRRSVTNCSARGSEPSWTPRAPPAAIARHRRSTAIIAVPEHLAVGDVRRPRRDRRRRPRPRGGAGVRARRRCSAPRPDLDVRSLGPGDAGERRLDHPPARDRAVPHADRGDAAVVRATLLWIVLCVTDGIDGWLARRQGTTRSGAFLDPLADKVLVLGAMWALVASDRFAVVPVILITVRELTHPGVPLVLGAARARRPGDGLGQGEDGDPGGRRRPRPRPACSRTSCGSPTPRCGWPSP